MHIVVPVNVLLTVAFLSMRCFNFSCCSLTFFGFCHSSMFRKIVIKCKSMCITGIYLTLIE